MAGKDGVLDSIQTASLQSEVASEVRVPVVGKTMEKKENKTAIENHKVQCSSLFTAKVTAGGNLNCGISLLFSNCSSK